MTDISTRTADENAAEFKALDRQGKDFRLALLAACSVEKTAPGPKPKGDRNDCNDLKLSAQAFGRKAGTSAPRVLRHLEAWDTFAKLAKLSVAAKLTPSHAVTLDVSPEQIEIFDKRGPDAQVTLGTTTEKVITQNKKAMQEAIRNDPATRKAAAAALAGTDEGTEFVKTQMADPAVATEVLEDPKANKGAIEGGRRVIKRKLVKSGATPTTTKTTAGTSPGAAQQMVSVLEVSQGITRVDIAMRDLTNIIPNASEDSRHSVVEWLDGDHTQQCDELREQSVGLANISPEDFG